MLDWGQGGRLQSEKEVRGNRSQRELRKQEGLRVSKKKGSRILYALCGQNGRANDQDQSQDVSSSYGDFGMKTSSRQLQWTRSSEALGWDKSRTAAMCSHDATNAPLIHEHLQPRDRCRVTAGCQAPQPSHVVHQQPREKGITLPFYSWED